MASKNQAPQKVTSNISVGNAKIVLRNFSGKAGKYNAAGVRSFCVLFDEDMAKQLSADGWNIKYFSPREEGDPPQAYLKVAVSYTSRPPSVMMITQNGKMMLDEESINVLDWADIENIDLIISPYNWEVGDKFGVKAYLRTMYATVVEDEFASKYRDEDDSAPPWN